jgi:hypothetical protein
MYQRAKTWNPFKGCGFACTYCVESFQRQAKRLMHKCSLCYQYQPHFHPERMDEIPSAPIIFVCGNGDIAFASPEERSAIIARIRTWTNQHPRSETVFYLQSKQPSCLEPHLAELPGNVILVTTLETNRDGGYEAVSKAPPPSERYRQFLALNYPRKIVTVEPVMDFDPEVFAEWIGKIRPELVYLGFNSRKEPRLPEPSLEKLVRFTSLVSGQGIPIVEKTLRGLVLPGVASQPAVYDGRMPHSRGRNGRLDDTVHLPCLTAPSMQPRQVGTSALKRLRGEPKQGLTW